MGTLINCVYCKNRATLECSHPNLKKKLRIFGWTVFTWMPTCRLVGGPIGMECEYRIRNAGSYDHTTSADYQLASIQYALDCLKIYKANESFILNTKIKPSELEYIGVRKSDLDEYCNSVPPGIKIFPLNDDALEPGNILLIKKGAFEFNKFMLPTLEEE